MAIHRTNALYGVMFCAMFAGNGEAHQVSSSARNYPSDLTRKLGPVRDTNYSKVPAGGTALGAAAQANAPVRRMNIALDGGNKVIVDNASHMSDFIVQNIVLAADRSTRTGCPFNGAKRGLFAVGDRIFINDNYVAWFDYTGHDGNSSATTWYRSGALTGLWTLDPDNAGATGLHFKYVYGSDNPSVGICFNWPRNELIPGSNSPQGQAYWWDTYAPPLEHTMVIAESASDFTKSSFYSSVYAAGTAGSNFSLYNDGQQDGNQDLHYGTNQLMTAQGGKLRYTSINQNSDRGLISNNYDYILGASGITVVWNFMPSLDASVNNLYVGLFTSYSGGRTSICQGGYPVPPDSFGNRADLASSSLNMTRTSPPAAVEPETILGIDWNDPQAVPCNGVNPTVDATSPTGAIQAGDWMRNSRGDGHPRWKLTNLQIPDAGSGTVADPIGFPFSRFTAAYENNDQAMDLLIARGGHPTEPSYWYTLRSGMWYRVSYSITPE